MVEPHTVRRTVAPVLPILAGLGAHLALAPILRGGLAGRWWLAALAFVLVCLALALIGIVGSVTRGRGTLFLLAGVPAVGGAFVGLHVTVLAGVLVEFLGLALFLMAVRHEAAARVRYSVGRTIGYSLTIGLIMMLLAISLEAFPGLESGAATGKLQADAVASITAATERSLSAVYRGFDSSATVDEVIRRQLPSLDEVLEGVTLGAVTPAQRSEVERRLREAGLSVDPTTLDSTLQSSDQASAVLRRQLAASVDQAETAAVTEVRNRIASSFGIGLRGDETVHAALTQVVAHRIQSFTQPNLRYLPPILALSLFLTLLLFTWLFSAVTLGLAWLAFEVIVHTGLVMKVTEQVTATRFEV